MSALRKVGKIAVALAAMVIVLLVGGYAWLLLAAPADVRSAEIRQGGASKEAAARGRALLEELAERHGYRAWRDYRTQEVVVEDTWSGGGSFWPGPRQRYRARRLLGTFTSRLELLDGPRQGELWGIQSWLPYARSPQGEPLEPDPIVEFALPTFQYFDELVFRLLEAPIVLDNGSGVYRGREHRRVFVTWDRPEPHVENDQYDLWIDPDSGLMAVVYYTVRDAMKLSAPLMRPVVKVLGAGTMHYGDYREIGGVQVAFKQTVTLQPPGKTRLPVDDHYFHQLVLASAGFDTFDPDELVVDPSRPELGDAKPR